MGLGTERGRLWILPMWRDLGRSPFWRFGRERPERPERVGDTAQEAPAPWGGRTYDSLAMAATRDCQQAVCR